MMTNEARVAAVMERVRARVQLRKQRRMAGVLVLAMRRWVRAGRGGIPLEGGRLKWGRKFSVCAWPWPCA